MMKLKRIHTPLLDRLKEHYDQQQFSFHVPGHKYGELWPDNILENSLLTLDATELRGLDDLHDASKVIKEAQVKTAQFYSADRSYFLVNGTTVGNLAMILATCQKGSNVIVQRNSHKSIMNGIELAGARPVFLTPEIDEVTGVSTGITYEQIQQAFQRYESIDAVILTNPNYYGMTQDLTDIIDYVHTQSCPVLVDEAHGAHFGIGHSFPPSALSMGADVVVQSAHKTLPAMTMASFMHVRSSFINYQEIEAKLQILQSSSPSYVLMASLDYARAYVESLESSDIEQINTSIEALKKRLDKIPQIQIVQASKGCDYLDPLKMIVQSRTKLSGYEMQRVFENVGIYTELADPYNVLFILPLTSIKRMDELVSLIKHSLDGYEAINISKPDHTAFKLPSMTTIELNATEISRVRTIKIPLIDAIGKISADTIIPYPPGIPILLKGERIMKEHVDYCQYLFMNKARFQGNDLVGGISVIQ